MLPPLPPPVLLAEAHPLLLLELLSFRSQQFLSNDPAFSLPVSSLCSPLHPNIFFSTHHSPSSNLFFSVLVSIFPFIIPRC